MRPLGVGISIPPYLLGLLTLMAVLASTVAAAPTSPQSPQPDPPRPGFPRLDLEGSLTQGALLIGRTEAGARVSLDTRPVRVSREGWFLVAFGRDAGSRASLMIEHPQRKTLVKALEIAPRQYQTQRINGLPPRKVNPSEKDLERIRREIRLVRVARRRDEPRTDFLEGFLWPVQGRITGIYGSQRILNGEPRRPHFGIDIASPVGTPVRAPAAGVVSFLDPDMFFSGGTLILDHGHGLSSSFLHLSRILVAQGDVVKQGQVVAEVGATGRVTGPHLDWRMNWLEVRIDPGLLVPALSQ